MCTLVSVNNLTVGCEKFWVCAWYGEGFWFLVVTIRVSCFGGWRFRYGFMPLRASLWGAVL